MFKHILIPTDGSKLSGIAVKAGVKLAATLGAKVTLYRAVGAEFGDAMGEGVVLPRTVRERMARESRAQVEAAIDETAKVAAAAGVSFDTVLGKTFSPWQGIVETAKKRKCDAIVIASHGWGGVASVMLGSVTQKVLAHSKVPVLVYR